MLAERIGASQLAEMSAQGVSLESTLRPRDLPRLREVVADGPGLDEESLLARVGLGIGPEAHPVVRIEVQGTLQLVCQRCLAPVAWPLDLRVALTAVGSESLAEELADPFDSVLLDEEGGLPLRAAVEDEVLAALPISPRHESTADCEAAGARPGALTEPAPAQVSRPFAELATLLGRQPGDTGEK